MSIDSVRRASVSGSFYASTKSGLMKQIEDSFKGGYGPERLPEIKDRPGSLKGVIVPHAGIQFSGSVAAHSYLAIAEDGFADAFIILGPNHQGWGSGVALYPKGKWETPLGDINMDTALIENLVGDIIDVNEASHPSGENSIEVQIPFLQYIGRGKDFSVALVSMAMQDFETVNEVGKIIGNVIQKDGRRIIIIASSDFSHEGGAYGRLPPNNFSADQYARKQDQLAIDEIVKMNPKGLISTVYNKNISMCGYGPVAAMLIATKKIGAKKAELLKYITSNDVHPSSHCVGYGSFKIY
jgi:AmmeMemoRadiSam system protein B